MANYKMGGSAIHALELCISDRCVARCTYCFNFVNDAIHPVDDITVLHATMYVQRVISATSRC